MRLLSEHLNQTVPRSLLALVRFYLGVVFLLAVASKLGGEPDFATRLPVILERLGETSHGFYRGFLRTAVIPTAGLFAGLIVVAELTVTVSLLLGVATRLGAGLAIFLLLNYMLLKGAWFWTPSSNDAAFFFIGLVVMLGAAGRAFGLDFFLVRRWPRVPLW